MSPYVYALRCSALTQYGALRALVSELSIDATKSQFKTARVVASSRDVSPDIL